MSFAGHSFTAIKQIKANRALQKAIRNNHRARRKEIIKRSKRKQSPATASQKNRPIGDAIFLTKRSSSFTYIWAFICFLGFLALVYWCLFKLYVP